MFRKFTIRGLLLAQLAIALALWFVLSPYYPVICERISRSVADITRFIVTGGKDEFFPANPNRNEN